MARTKAKSLVSEKPFYRDESLSNEESLIERSRAFSTFYAPHFSARREALVINGTKNAANAVKECLGKDIALNQ